MCATWNGPCSAHESEMFAVRFGLLNQNHEIVDLENGLSDVGQRFPLMLASAFLWGTSYSNQHECRGECTIHVHLPLLQSCKGKVCRGHWPHPCKAVGYREMIQTMRIAFNSDGNVSTMVWSDPFSRFLKCRSRVCRNLTLSFAST